MTKDTIHFNCAPVGINSENWFILDQNFPNPFNNKTKIPFVLLNNSKKVTLSIYSITNSKIYEKSYGSLSSGSYNFIWYPNKSRIKIESGYYIYSVSTQKGYVISKKMIYLKNK